MLRTCTRLPIYSANFAPTFTQLRLQALRSPQTQLPAANISFLKRFFFGSSTSPETMSAAKTKVNNLVKENPVVVFSKSYCPYCRATKSLLAEQGANAHVLELDEIDDGSAIQAALKDETGQSTVPSVWIGGEFIGGNSDLQKITNKLPQMLKNAGALSH